MKKHRSAIFVIVVLLIIAFFSVANTYLIIKNQRDMHDVIQKNMRLNIPKDGYTPIKGVDYNDGVTPVKDKDYFDGKDGESTKGKDGVNGKDSISTHKETVIIEQVPINGKDGFTPEIRCNASKNRWEVRYSYEMMWVAILNEDGLPSKCLPI